MYTIVSYKSYKRERVGFNHLKVHLKYFFQKKSDAKINIQHQKKNVYVL